MSPMEDSHSILTVKGLLEKNSFNPSVVLKVMLVKWPSIRLPYSGAFCKCIVNKGGRGFSNKNEDFSKIMLCPEDYPHGQGVEGVNFAILCGRLLRKASYGSSYEN